MNITLKHTDTWQDVKNSTMVTIGKKKGSYPNEEWKQKMIFAEHSPIRKIKISVFFEKIKYCIVMHFVRHKVGVEHFVSTQRTDRTGVNRDDLPQSNLINYEMDADAQAMINMSRRRLCNCAAKETRETWERVREEVREVEPELAHCMVRECVYRNGLCPEMNSCGFNKTEAFKKELEEYIAPIKDQVV